MLQEVFGFRKGRGGVLIERKTETYGNFIKGKKFSKFLCCEISDIELRSHNRK